ncbi:UDP-N-acetylmuramoyl-L-alanine--D-glutamate ligase [Candidatus Dependentiae bacterium]|nr:UDP-N-acetylmuramoyl-L-alanine--D-glutamate ligase [Candidatus Dependentiae bacterium]
MHKKKYGIWGYGIVGKSVLRYLHSQGHHLTVMDRRAPSEEEKLFLEAHRIGFTPQEEQSRFFADNDYIVVSPGIARTSALPSSKVVEELDLFCDAWKNQLIAVTGSLGKTSTVELLSQIMRYYGHTVALGGNVGTGMLDLLALQETHTYALLELSSFQLEHSTRCKPDLVLWLNFYPNHLDRHHTLEGYFLAKYAIMRYQDTHQKALVPFALKELLRAQTDRALHFFSPLQFSDATLSSLGPTDTFYGKHGSNVMRITTQAEEVIMPVNALPHISFEENWLALIATLDILLIQQSSPLATLEIKIPEHRLEKIAVINGVTFYNDSKSSVFEATQAAVESLQPQRIHLLLGGVSKGVDRISLLPALKGKVESLHCFGGEAEELCQAALKAGIRATSYPSLDQACKGSYSHASSADIILLSPAGASFDLFSNYKERGEAFKEIVHTTLSVQKS